MHQTRQDAAVGVHASIGEVLHQSIEHEKCGSKAILMFDPVGCRIRARFLESSLRWEGAKGLLEEGGIGGCDSARR